MVIRQKIVGLKTERKGIIKKILQDQQKIRLGFKGTAAIARRKDTISKSAANLHTKINKGRKIKKKRAPIIIIKIKWISKRFFISLNDEEISNNYIESSDDDINKYSVFCDTGASNDIFNNIEWTTNLWKKNQHVKVGNGNSVQADYIGDKHVIIIQKNNFKQKMVFKDILIVKKFGATYSQ